MSGWRRGSSSGGLLGSRPLGAGPCEQTGSTPIISGCQLHVTTATDVFSVYSLSVELRHHVQAGESSLQEVLFVPLHLNGPQPLGH